MSIMPLVSVIIPCYNQGHFLGEAIRSTLDQTYPRVEIIVVDDGSDDRTPEVARSYSGVRYVRQDNQGVSAARNAGFTLSRGEYRRLPRLRRPPPSGGHRNELGDS